MLPCLASILNDILEFKVYKWLRANTLERIYSKSEALPADKQIWKEREDAERAIQAYLSDLPSTVTFVHGPQGSGKSTMIASALKSAERYAQIFTQDTRTQIDRIENLLLSTVVSFPRLPPMRN